MSDLDVLRGDLNSLRETVNGRLDGLERRLDDAERWEEESRRFHVEMRQRWDLFDGARTKEAEMQALRHDENTVHLQEISNQVSRKNLWAAIVGVAATIACLIVAIVGIMVAIKLARVSDLRDLTPMHTTEISPAYTATTR